MMIPRWPLREQVKKMWTQLTALKKDVKYPPTATFFSRFGDKEELIEGPYEEQYLSYLEREAWIKQKENMPS